MDDFLHNLRSGKLKQPDRSNRPYGDQNYKSTQRRNMMDRRKRDFESKESFERLSAIKEVLDAISETQKRMADAYEARTSAEERKAVAMEVLAKSLYRMVNPDAEGIDELFALPKTQFKAQENSSYIEAADAPSSEDADDESMKMIADLDSPSDGKKRQKLTAEERQTLIGLISDLRNQGQSWEKIAREITAQGYSTISGKGTWRGIMAKNLLEKETAE